MTREIKFRAWDKKDRVIRDVLGISFPHESISVDIGDGKYLQDNASRFDLMQYTGFKDIDNREIYDGYIVEISGHPLQREGRGEGFGAGIEIDGVYEVARDDRAPSFVIGNWVFHEVYRFCKVIGNIHEHSHLLGSVD